jgi:multiple sugar transport system substrate-binding protein
MLGHFKNWIAPETTGKWGAAHLPGGTYTQRGGTWYGIPEAAEHKDEAWKLVKFLTTNPDIQLRAFEVTNAFPAELAVWEDPIFEKPIPFLADQTARLLWKEAVLHITGAPTNVNDAIAMEIVTDALTQVLEEGRAIEDVLAEAKELIERRVAL